MNEGTFLRLSLGVSRIRKTALVNATALETVKNVLVSVSVQDQEVVVDPDSLKFVPLRMEAARITTCHFAQKTSLRQVEPILLLSKTEDGG